MTIALERAEPKAQTEARGADLSLAFRFALRELRRGLSGFGVFVACIALGVAAIVGVNAVALSITEGVSDRGKEILGGDINFGTLSRPLAPDERRFVEGLGRTSQSVTMRAMSRTLDNGEQVLVEAKAVDAAYPLSGELVTEPPLDAARLAASGGVAVDPILLARLGVKLGDRIAVGRADFPIVATIVAEPDRASHGLLFGPRVMMGPAQLEAAGLVQPGSLVLYKNRVDLAGPNGEASAEAIDAVFDEAKARFPEAGWRLESRTNAAPALKRSVDRFAQFLTLVGLTSLIVGGVGVANATRAYLDGKRSVIATFKGLGAPAMFVFAVYLIQILMIAAVGVAFGLLLGSLMQPVAVWALAGVIPVAPGSAFQPSALAAGLAYGFLTALAFALWPLGRARDVPATDLFRSGGREDAGWPRPVFVAATGLVLLALAALAILQAQDSRTAWIFVGAVVFAFALLRGVSWVVQWAARRVRHVRSTPLRMAIGNIHRPGALTTPVVLSLGLGLALLVALAQIDGNLRNQLQQGLPDDAPEFFFIDIQSGEYDRFAAFLRERHANAEIVATPMLRGRITELDGVPAQDADVAESGEWVLRGDRGVTYGDEKPENATLAEGEWWPEGHSGEPLVSFAAEEAGEIGIGVGDTITVNVLGRDITARVANLRNVEWESFGMNFLMVFSANTFAGAPHQYLATLNLPSQGGAALAGPETEAIAERDAAVLRAVTSEFPTVTAVRVRDVLGEVNKLIVQLGTGIRAAAAIALIASILVLAGALAAGNRARTHDAVVLKTLGATRRTLIGTYVLEYSLLGLATAVFALFAGTIAAWFVLTQIMQLNYMFLPAIALVTIALALVFTVGVGLLGTWRVLGQKPAGVLREL